LIVKRREHLTAGEQKALAQLFAYAPELRVLRTFVDELYGLFERSQTEATAWWRHAALLSQPAYAAIPELAQALAMLTTEQYRKMIAFLWSPVGCRVRTNNHVERMNRVLRLYEKSRYKWRQARSKVRFVWLLVERRWGQQVQEWCAGGGEGCRQEARERPWVKAEGVNRLKAGGQMAA
jgi:hypothetical protein